MRYRVVMDCDYVGGALLHFSTTAARQDAGCFVGHGACANLGKQRVICGFSWLLRVIDHEAALSPGGSKVVLKLGSQVSGVVETVVWTADMQPVALLAKNQWDSTSISAAARDKGHTGDICSKNGDRAAEVGMPLFTMVLGLYGGVLWSGELQGAILYETSPNKNTKHCNLQFLIFVLAISPPSGGSGWWFEELRSGGTNPRPQKAGSRG
jgi:hypothetical protein